MIKNADTGHLMIVISFKEMSMQIDFSDKYYSPVFYALKKKKKKCFSTAVCSTLPLPTFSNLINLFDLPS